MDFHKASIIEKEKLGNIKSKCQIQRIRSKYILKIIFNNLHKDNFFEIMRYNKSMQRIFNININNYKEYSQIYSPIEIEIIPAENKYDKIINIDKRADKKYYHIYFNNNKKETKKYYIEKKDEVKKIKILIDYQVKSFYKLFENCYCIKSIFFKKFHRNNISDMGSMFSWCSSLEKLNLSKAKTDNVNYMDYMFSWCESLKELNLSSFNTNNVKDMNNMFKGCSSLKELNLSNFGTNNVKNMNSMFKGCSSLKELNLSNFKTNNVNNMNDMFSGCLEELKMKIKSLFNNLKEEAFN